MKAEDAHKLVVEHDVTQFRVNTLSFSFFGLKPLLFPLDNEL